MKAEKRMRKYSTKPLKKFSKIRPFLVYPFRLKTRKSARKFIRTVLREFFFLQLKKKLKILKNPLIYVDTPLDDKIPFTPQKINDYMTFFSFIIKLLDFFYQRLGYKESAKMANEYMDFLEEIYRNASSVYKFAMTTTHRPKYYKGQFLIIHLLDPHFLCAPSLHVSISAGIYKWFKTSISYGILPKEEADWRLNEIKVWAVRTVESVLLVKQHSINCIPAAFYMLTASKGAVFYTIDDAVNFIDMLFCDDVLISDEIKKMLADHFHLTYERFLLENKYSSRWQEPLERWLTELDEKTSAGIHQETT